MARQRKPGLGTVLLLGALYYFFALPVGYVYAGDWLGCSRSYGFACRPAVKRTPLQRARSAVMLYLADNPRRCPTVEDLVEERYLPEAYAVGIEIWCEDGDVEVFGPAPAPTPLEARWRRRACRGLDLAARIWALPIRGTVWAWRAAARAFV